MYTNTFTVALIAALSAVASAGSAIVNNYCDSDVYLWSIDNEDYSPPMHTLHTGETYSEPYRSMSSGGVSIKMGHSQDLYSGAPITQFEYTLTDTIWYDISNIDGNPFSLGGLDLTPSDSSCPAKVCPAGLESLCKAAYNQPDDNEATAACSASSDTIFNLCPAQKGSSQPKAAASAPAPSAEKQAPAAPATTAAPAVEAEVITAIGHPDWVWTTFVTQVVTVYERDAAPEPTAAPAKRDEAADSIHKRAAHRHHVHQHGADAN